MGDLEMTRITSQFARLAPIALCAVAASACMSPHGDTVEEKRGSVQEMRRIVLEKAYEEEPELKSKIMSAAGYAVFDTAVTKILIIGTGNGYGLIVDNTTGAETITENFGIAVGPGIELSHTYGIAILNTQAALDAALSGDWNFGGTALLGFKFGDFGGSLDTLDLGGGADNYRLFQTGIGIHASLVWVDMDRDDELN
jgi:lipid-binding SYLF domain-containing protein